MPAKSVAAFSRTSRSDDARSIAATSISSKKTTNKIRLSTDSLKNKQNFEKMMENVTYNINKLFFNIETKVQVDKQLKEVIKEGKDLVSVNPGKYTEELVSEFFKQWSQLAAIINHYYVDIDGIERLTRFVDETTNKICETIQPLKEFIFDEGYPQESKKAKKIAKSCQDTFEAGIGLMSQQIYQYTTNKCSLDILLKNVQQLLLSVKQQDNLFFKQPRSDASDISYQTLMMLNRILECLYDYSAEEKSAFDCIENLNMTTKKLKLIFKYNPSDPERLSSKRLRDLRQGIPRSKISQSDIDYLENENNDSLSKKSRKKIKNGESDDGQNDKNNIKNKKKKGNNNKGDLKKVKGEEYTVTTPRLQYLQNKDKVKLEISELTSEIEEINKKIEIYIARANLTADQIHQQRRSQYVEIYYGNQLINDKIRFVRDFKKAAKKDLKSWSDQISELWDTYETSTKGKNDVKSTKNSMKITNEFISNEIMTVNSEIERLKKDLKNQQALFAKSTKISEAQCKRDEVMRAIRDISLQSEGFQNSIEELQKAEEIQTAELEKIQKKGTSEIRSKNVRKMQQFAAKRKKASNDLKESIENEPPIQAPVKISDKLEEFRKSKVISERSTRYQHKLEAMREDYQQYMVTSKQLSSDLVEAIAEKDETKIKLFNELTNEQNEAKIDKISNDTSDNLCQTINQNLTLQNEIETIEKWIDRICPQFRKRGYSLSQKILHFKKQIISNDLN